MSFIITFLIFIQTNYIKGYTDFSYASYNNTIEMETGISKIHFIGYKKNTNLSFDIKDENNYQINIRSINCNIKIEYDGDIINQKYLKSYSLEMDYHNNNLIITPLIDIIDGEEKEDYDNKDCLLSINSIKIEKPQLQIEHKMDSEIFFDHSNLNSLNIAYNIDSDFKEDNFIAMLIQFEEKSNFSIVENYKNDIKQIELISKKIQNSAFIYFNSFILNNASDNSPNGILSINIEKMDDKNLSINLKIVEKNIVLILEKNELNYGFIASKTKNQYYYMEIFQEEEGEIILHNKRLYGELYAKIVNKSQINITELYNPLIYPNRTLDNTNETYLYYNPHTLTLKYNSEDTENCFKGCYLLITYEQKNSEEDFPLFGYEFTLISRYWNISDYISNIVDIQFNEYIMGSFEKGAISHHYYSVSIPDDAAKFIIQIEGNYIEGSMEKEEKK